MSTVQRGTQTQDHAASRDASPHGPELVRFFRADDPLDESASFTLSRHPKWDLGRVDSRPSAVAGRALIWSHGDLTMSGRHAVVAKTTRGWEIADVGSKNGTRVNGQKLGGAELLRHGDIIECGSSFFVFREQEDETCYSTVPYDTAIELPPLHYQLAPVQNYIASDIALHFYGETGTGKEVIARAVHSLSGRSGQFVGLNCAAIPESLFESEMFGYKRGAFSGAAQSHCGSVLMAHGGTLFLDEVGELSPILQAKLLRVLELKEVLQVGADAPTPVDFRLVSATLCDLKALVDAGRFRADLYARLGYSCRVEPLREHKEELGRLIQRCLAARLVQRRSAGGRPLRVQFTLNAARVLVHHDWPYNIRQLKQCLDSSFLASAAELGRDDEWCRIDVRHFPESTLSSAIEQRGTRRTSAEASTPPPRALARDENLSDREIIDALHEADGNRSEAARLLGVCERTVYRRLRKLRARRSDVFGGDPGRAL